MPFCLLPWKSSKMDTTGFCLKSFNFYLWNGSFEYKQFGQAKKKNLMYGVFLHKKHFKFFRAQKSKTDKTCLI